MYIIVVYVLAIIDTHMYSNMSSCKYMPQKSAPRSSLGDFCVWACVSTTAVWIQIHILFVVGLDDQRPVRFRIRCRCIATITSIGLASSSRLRADRRTLVSQVSSGRFIYSVVVVVVGRCVVVVSNYKWSLGVFVVSVSLCV